MKRILELLFTLLFIGLAGQIIYTVLTHPEGTRAAAGAFRGVVGTAFAGAGGQFAPNARRRSGGGGGGGGRGGRGGGRRG